MTSLDLNKLSLNYSERITRNLLHLHTIRPGGHTIRKNKSARHHHAYTHITYLPIIYTSDLWCALHRQMHQGREKDKVGLAHAHGNVVHETNESRGVGALIGDSNNCVCSTIMLSFCSDAC